MSDLSAGPDGGPPPVLLAALAAAAVIAVSLVALFGGFAVGSRAGAGDEAVAVGGSDATSAADARVALAISLEGDGSGEVDMSPREISCSESCEHDFASGTRVTLTAEAASGSTFEGWGGDCDGSKRCTILLDKDRSVSASFERKPAADPLAGPLCVDGGANGDPVCADEDAPQDEELDPIDEPTATDCSDGRDNDRDGLTDAAQDPDCLTGESESGKTSRGTTRAPSDCADGKDNDGDGLTDTAQDPDCVSGRTEGG